MSDSHDSEDGEPSGKQAHGGRLTRSSAFGGGFARSTPGGAYTYDIHPDGTRLAIAAGVALKDVVRDQVVVMNNFFDYVKRIVEGAK